MDFEIYASSFQRDSTFFTTIADILRGGMCCQVARERDASITDEMARSSLGALGLTGDAALRPIKALSGTIIMPFYTFMKNISE